MIRPIIIATTVFLVVAACVAQGTPTPVPPPATATPIQVPTITPTQEPSTPDPILPPASVPVPSPTPFPLRELRFFINPRDCATFLFDPQPLEGSQYRHGTPVTIHLNPSSDCRVKDWINVDSSSELAARVNMNADRIVQVNLERAPRISASTATPVPTVTPVTTSTSLPIPTEPLVLPRSSIDGHNVIELDGNNYEQYKTDENPPGLYLNMDPDHFGDFLDLQADRTFYLEKNGLGYSGTWESKGNEIILTWGK
jgi:hypothetical protein